RVHEHAYVSGPRGDRRGVVHEPGPRRAADVSARTARPAMGGLRDVAAGAGLDLAAGVVGGVRLELGCGDGADIARDLVLVLRGGEGAGMVRTAVPGGGAGRRGHHDPIRIDG